MDSISRFEDKFKVFELLANHFRMMGWTRSVSLEQVVELVGCSHQRAYTLVDEMVEADVLIASDEPNAWRLSPSSYLQLCLVLEMDGQLPAGIEIIREGFGPTWDD